MSRWSEIRVLKFLDIYEKHKCLWNPKYENYKNKPARNDAFDDILKELNIPNLTHNDIKLKIKSIRTIYMRELTAVFNSVKNGDSSYVPKLFWFKRADSFLRAVSLSRRGNFKQEYSNLKIKGRDVSEFLITPDSEHQEQIYKSEPQIEDRSKNSETMVQDSIQIICNEYHEASTPEDLPESQSNTTSITNSINCDPVRLHVSDAPATPSQQTRHTEEDECTLFCKSVAAELRSIPDNYSRTVAKFKIQEIVFQAQTGHYRKPVTSTPSTPSYNITMI